MPGLIGVADGSGARGTGTTDPSLAEEGVIHHHQGIAGIAGLDAAVHGWDTSVPVADIAITRPA